MKVSTTKAKENLSQITDVICVQHRPHGPIISSLTGTNREKSTAADSIFMSSCALAEPAWARTAPKMGLNSIATGGIAPVNFWRSQQLTFQANALCNFSPKPAIEVVDERIVRRLARSYRLFVCEWQHPDRLHDRRSGEVNLYWNAEKRLALRMPPQFCRRSVLVTCQATITSMDNGSAGDGETGQE